MNLTFSWPKTYVTWWLQKISPIHYTFWSIRKQAGPSTHFEASQANWAKQDLVTCTSHEQPNYQHKRTLWTMSHKYELAPWSFWSNILSATWVAHLSPYWHHFLSHHSMPRKLITWMFWHLQHSCTPWSVHADATHNDTHHPVLVTGFIEHIQPTSDPVLKPFIMYMYTVPGLVLMPEHQGTQEHTITAASVLIWGIMTLLQSAET